MSVALLLAAAAAVADVPPSPGRLTFVTGNTLLDYCTKPAGSDACLSYLSAVADTMTAGADLNGVRACVLRGVTTGQLRDVTVAFLQAHEEQRWESGGVLVPVALSLAYPCNSK